MPDIQQKYQAFFVVLYLFLHIYIVDFDIFLTMVFKPAAYRLIFDRLKQTKAKENNKKVKGLLQIEVYYNGQRKFVSTGIRVNPNEWDSKRQEIKSKNPNYETINKKLVRQIKELRDFKSNCEHKFKILFQFGEISNSLTKQSNAYNIDN